MKRIVLKEIQEQIPGREGTTTVVWSEIMLVGIRDGGLEGVTIDDMRKRIGLMDKIERAVKAGADHVLLETEEQKTLVAVMRARRFGGVFRAAIEMMDAIENAPDVEVTEASD